MQYLVLLMQARIVSYIVMAMVIQNMDNNNENNLLTFEYFELDTIMNPSIYTTNDIIINNANCYINTCSDDYDCNSLQSNNNGSEIDVNITDSMCFDGTYGGQNAESWNYNISGTGTFSLQSMTMYNGNGLKYYKWI